MINLKKLNKHKAYVGWQIGKGFISGLIQKLSTKETNIPVKEIATHIFMLVYEKEWMVIEAHLKWKGTKKLSFEEWQVDYKPENIFCAECELDTNNLNYLLDFNPGYSCAQITKDAINELTAQHFWNDSPGIVCSEFFANCDKNHQICRDNNLATYLIKPIHVQNKYKDKAIV